MDFDSAIANIDELWKTASAGSIAYRDLLGLLDAAIRFKTAADFRLDQLDAISDAYARLLIMRAEMVRNQKSLAHHQWDFVERDIDISRPLNGK